MAACRIARQRKVALVGIDRAGGIGSGIDAARKRGLPGRRGQVEIGLADTHIGAGRVGGGGGGDDTGGSESDDCENLHDQVLNLSPRTIRGDDLKLYRANW